MIRHVARACAAALVLCPALANAAEGQLTLDEAVKLALANNERALKAPLRVDVAQGQLERARAAFLPTIVASGTGTLLAQTDRNGRNLAGTGQAQINQPLLNLPAFPLYAQARHQLESEKWGAIEDKRTLEYDTAHAFLLAISNAHLLEAAQRRYDHARASQQDTQARADAQLTSTNDVTRLEVETASAETQVAAAQGNLERANLELAFLIGRPLTETLVAPQRTTSSAERGTFRADEILRFAESRRPDIRSSEEKTRSLQAAAEEPLYRLAPTLGASAVIHTTVDPVAPAVPYDEQAALTLTWTIYDAGQRYADRKTRVAQASSQALDEKALRRSIATDVAVALAALRAARETYRISEKAVDAAQRNTDETDILYKQGLARAIELTNANASRYDAEVNLESAKLSMEQAYLGLRQALGIDPTGEDLGGVAAATTPVPAPVTTGSNAAPAMRATPATSAAPVVNGAPATRAATVTTPAPAKAPPPNGGVR